MPRRPVMAGAGIVLLVCLAYLPALWTGWVFDDDTYVTANPKVILPDGIVEAWSWPTTETYTHQFYPLTTTLFWLQYQVWGDHPAGYKAVNILFHGCNAVLLWLILVRLRVPWPWVAAAIYGVHPVNVMSVAWITELKNVQSNFFYLASLLMFTIAFSCGDRQHEVATADGNSRGGSGEGHIPTSTGTGDVKLAHWGWYAGSIVWFVLALLSKTATAVLPIALLLVLWRQRGRLAARDGITLSPYIVLGVAFSLMTMHFERHFGGAGGSEWTLDFPQQVILFGQIMMFYTWKIIWPGELVFLYGRWAIDPAQWWWFAAPLLVIGILVTLFVCRRRIGRGPFAAAIYFTLAVGPMAFLPVFMMRFTFVSDHWQYWACMGLIPLLVAAAAYVVRRLGPRAERLGIVVAGIVIIGLCARTAVQTLIYKDLETLWTHTTERGLAPWMPYSDLGALHLEAAESYRQQGNTAGRQAELASARDDLLRSVEIYAGYERSQNNLGAYYYNTGDLQNAEPHFRAAIEANARYLNGYIHLITLLHDQHRYADALAVIAAAPDVMTSRPALVRLHVSTLNRLGMQFAQAGNLVAAADHFIALLELAPNSENGRLNLARTQIMLSRDAHAVATLSPLAGRAEDRYAEALLRGWALSNLHRWADASAAFRTAMAADRKAVEPAIRWAWVVVLNPLSTAADLTRAHRIAEGVVAQTAGRLPAGLDLLAASHARARRFDEAVAAATKAREVAARVGDSLLVAQIADRMASYARGEAVQVTPGQPVPAVSILLAPADSRDIPAGRP